MDIHSGHCCARPDLAGGRVAMSRVVVGSPTVRAEPVEAGAISSSSSRAGMGLMLCSRASTGSARTVFLEGFAPWLRQAQPERVGVAPLASTPSARTGRVERSDDPCGCWAPHPLLAAPASGWLRGGTRVRARVLRDLPGRGCLNGARQRAASSTAHPATDPVQVCPFAARRGRRRGVAFLLGAFLWRGKEKCLARRGDNPAPALNQGTLSPRPNRASTGSARTVWGSAPASTGSARTVFWRGLRLGFDKLSPNGLGGFTPGLDRLSPNGLG